MLISDTYLTSLFLFIFLILHLYFFIFSFLYLLYLSFIFFYFLFLFSQGVKWYLSSSNFFLIVSGVFSHSWWPLRLIFGFTISSVPEILHNHHSVRKRRIISSWLLFCTIWRIPVLFYKLSFVFFSFMRRDDDNIVVLIPWLRSYLFNVQCMEDNHSCDYICS